MIFRRIFLSHSSKKLREEPSNFSESFNYEVSKNFMRKNRTSRLSVESFLAQSAEGFPCRTLRYIRKVRLSKKFMPKKVISLFSVELFSRILAIRFAGETPCVSES